MGAGVTERGHEGHFWGAVDFLDLGVEYTGVFS